MTALAFLTMFALIAACAGLGAYLLCDGTEEP